MSVKKKNQGEEFWDGETSILRQTLKKDFNFLSFSRFYPPIYPDKAVFRNHWRNIVVDVVGGEEKGKERGRKKGKGRGKKGEGSSEVFFFFFIFLGRLFLSSDNNLFKIIIREKLPHRHHLINISRLKLRERKQGKKNGEGGGKGVF